MWLSDIAVVIKAHRRPYYLEPVLQSWAQARGLQQVSRFAVCLDRGDRHERMLQVIADVQKARYLKRYPPFEVVHDSPAAVASPGMHRGLGEALDLAFTNPHVRFAVVGEEDILVSDDILEYMRWAAGQFARDPRVLAVCGHNRGGQGWDVHRPSDDGDASQLGVQLLPYFNAWGWGTWRDCWEQILRPEWDWDGTSGGPLDSGWDWNIAVRIRPRHGAVCVVPDASRTQNIGFSEGYYSTPESFAFSQARSFRLHRASTSYVLGAQ